MDLTPKEKLFFSIQVVTIFLIIVGFLYLSTKSSISAIGSSITFPSAKYNFTQEFTGLKMVTKVIDGDTVLIEGEKVRLLGIDADERGYPCYEPAKLRLEELILNKEVYLETDQENKDEFGRPLRYFWLNSTNINLKLIQEGLAVARVDNSKYAKLFKYAEKRARELRIGCKWEKLEWNKLKGDVINACEARDYIGKEQIVQGKVVTSYKSEKVIFLNLERAYPNHCFTIVIFKSDWSKFESPEYYEGKTIRVKGIIKEYKGNPEIILKYPSQIEIGK